MNNASGVFVLGSTEPHYTPSKTYQAVLSKKPLLAVLHNKSTAVGIIRRSKTGIVLGFDGETDVYSIKDKFAVSFLDYISFMNTFHQAQIDLKLFEMYSANFVTSQLVNLIESI